MYAHLCHSEIDPLDDERNGSKRLLSYYPQHHQFHGISSRPSSPVPSKTPFSIATTSLFPTQQNLYSGHHHMSNLHEGDLINLN